MEFLNNQYPQLSKAPINEAILEILVELPPSTLKNLDPFKAIVGEAYTKVETLTNFHTTISLNKEGKNDLEKEDLGYLFMTEDKCSAIQTRLNGFSFGQIKKSYKGWDLFVSEARDYFEKYFEIISPSSIQRISLRFINQIDIPLPFNEFKEYILTIPDIAPGLPNELTSMFMQLTIRSKEHNAEAIITETFNTIQDNKLPFIFDIDVIQQLENQKNFKAIWDNFEKLRMFKNKVFFNSITDKTFELIK